MLADVILIDAGVFNQRAELPLTGGELPLDRANLELVKRPEDGAVIRPVHALAIGVHRAALDVGG
jgi:hypothetical protein